MTLLGNILLAGTALLALYLMGLVYGPKPPQSGDAAVGYPWAVIILHLMLLVGFGLVALIIGYQGGFAWINLGSVARGLAVAGALAGILLVNALACMFKFENGPLPPPFSLPGYNVIVPALFPAVLTFAAALLLNAGLKAQFPEHVLRYALTAVIGIAGAGLLGGLGGWLVQAGKNAAGTAAARRAYYDKIDLDHLRDIEACDPASRQVANILSYTSVHTKAQVREKALEKLKSNPRWQEHLADLMTTGASLEVFSFLAWNDVDDPSLFAAPLEPAVRSVADWIRRTVRNATHPSHLYEGQFTFDIERVLRTLDRFEKSGVDYVPAVREIRAALEEKSEYKKVRFRAVDMVDKWLKRH